MSSQYQLLSVESDPKTTKGTAMGYLTGILYLAPASEADGMHNLCTMATDECRTACLYGQGMAGVFPSIKRARIEKTLEYLTDPEAFKARLAADIRKLVKVASKRGLKPAVRINGTSDVPKLAHELAAQFPEVQFYDYTKLPKAWLRVRSNYHITFSFSGSNLTESIEALAHDVNVAVVFHGALPETWHGYRVINGDESDLRFLDSRGVVVGLKAKGTARTMAVGGFIQLGAVA